MAIRIRKVKNKNATGGFSYIALCAAETESGPGDIYLDDAVHHALGEKFYTDYVKMGFIKKSEVTENWIEEKAIEIYNYLYYKTFNLDQVRNFIRLLLVEKSGK